MGVILAENPTVFHPSVVLTCYLRCGKHIVDEEVERKGQIVNKFTKF